MVRPDACFTQGTKWQSTNIKNCVDVDLAVLEKEQLALLQMFLQYLGWPPSPSLQIGKLIGFIA